MSVQGEDGPPKPYYQIQAAGSMVCVYLSGGIQTIVSFLWLYSSDGKRVCILLQSIVPLKDLVSNVCIVQDQTSQGQISAAVQ